jgi:cell division septum initiation protein DivIVA
MSNFQQQIEELEAKLNAATNSKPKPKGFTPKTKDFPRSSYKVASPTTAEKTASTVEPSPSSTIPTAKETASTLSHQSHDAMKALQGTGLENAAAYIQRQQTDRNAIVEKVSDAIAYLCDPDVLEADIMSAAAAKVAARSNAWGYTESTVDLDTLFALPTPSPRLIKETR